MNCPKLKTKQCTEYLRHGYCIRSPLIQFALYLQTDWGVGCLQRLNVPYFSIIITTIITVGHFKILPYSRTNGVGSGTTLDTAGCRVGSLQKPVDHELICCLNCTDQCTEKAQDHTELKHASQIICIAGKYAEQIVVVLGSKAISVITHH